jgi:hypothetical protein
MVVIPSSRLSTWVRGRPSCFSLRYSLVQVVNDGGKPRLQVEYKGERKTFLFFSKKLSGSGGE